MPWAAVGAAVVGGYMQNSAAKKQAGAMDRQSAAQVEAARIAAEEARFRPIGITTRFGSATPEFTDDRLTGYDYQGSPELVGLQDQLSRIYGSSLNQAEQAAGYQPQFQQAAEGLFNLGQQEIPQSREQLMAEQQALLRPYDMEQEQRMLAAGFGRGTTGLSVGAGGNPMLQAQAEARSRRDQQLLANIDQKFMNRAQQSAGLFTGGAGLLGTNFELQQGALSPFTSQFQTAQDLENTARGAMDIGTALGARTTTANTNAGMIMQGGQAAAGNLQVQAANARAQSQAGMGQGIADLGLMYSQGMFNQQGRDRSAPIENRPIAPRTAMPINTSGGQNYPKFS
jgi:hypothetical protein